MKSVLTLVIMFLGLNLAGQSDSIVIHAYDSLSTTMFTSYPANNYMILDSLTNPKNFEKEQIIEYQLFDTVRIEKSFFSRYGYDRLDRLELVSYSSKSDSINNSIKNDWDKSNPGYLIKEKYGKWPLAYSFGLISKSKEYLWVEFYELDGGLFVGSGGIGILFKLENGYYNPLIEVLWD